MSFYHASSVKNINELEPRVSNHNIPLIYFSNKRENVLVYLSNAIEKVFLIKEKSDGTGDSKYVLSSDCNTTCTECDGSNILDNVFDSIIGDEPTPEQDTPVEQVPTAQPVEPEE